MRERRRTVAPFLLTCVLFVAACGHSSPGERLGGESSDTARLELSGSAVGSFGFGSDGDTVVSDLSRRFGPPDVSVGPKRYHRQDGRHEWFADKQDPLSEAWSYPVLSVSCWQALCLLFGGTADGELALRGWELASFNRWAGSGEVDQGSPEVSLAETGIRLGDSWKALHEAYPATTVSGGEGNSLTVQNAAWDGIFDGVGAWRLSGQWDFEHPTSAPPGATVTRLSAGEGPEPGCC